ncbi:MAG: ribonuclease Y [Myxococcota bacterium]|jgi:ribonuclease Y|nr:ribonuclease Y [Myxococcota bacterium]
MEWIIALLVGLAAGAAAAYLLARKKTAANNAVAEAEAKRIVDEASAEAENLRRRAATEAKEIQLQAREQLEKEARERKAELEKREEHMLHREEKLDQKADGLTEQENALKAREQEHLTREKTVEEQAKKHQALLDKAQAELTRVAGLTKDEAKQEVVAQIAEQARSEAARTVKQIEDEAREEGEQKAKRLIALAIQRYAGEYVVERTVSTVTLSSDEMKGRIIGREGRNIRAIEAATGCDLVIDDTPEAVVVSCFDPVRREIAKLALEKLLEDGRIHPSRIEEIVESSNAQIEKEIKDAGQKAAFDLGLHGIAPELLKLVGRLKYRYSYAQNVWSHSMETAFIAGMIAAELDLNVKIARRAGLLHDIGKAVDHEVEGSHAVIGARIAKKNGERQEVVDAIAGHHDDVEAQTIYAHIVAAADALSGARPGARREMLESYVQRLEQLERIASDFKGVDKAYAIQAGREVRVLVQQDRVDDAGAVLLAKDIAKKIEDDLVYPGQIKVCVIRETRAVEIAR